jgi:hypothetical protein
MNVEIGSEAAQFPEKEYINGIFLALQFGASHKKTVVTGGWGVIVRQTKGNFIGMQSIGASPTQVGGRDTRKWVDLRSFV